MLVVVKRTTPFPPLFVTGTTVNPAVKDGSVAPWIVASETFVLFQIIAQVAVPDRKAAFPAGI